MRLQNTISNMNNLVFSQNASLRVYKLLLLIAFVQVAATASALLPVSITAPKNINFPDKALAPPYGFFCTNDPLWNMPQLKENDCIAAYTLMRREEVNTTQIYEFLTEAAERRSSYPGMRTALTYTMGERRR